MLIAAGASVAETRLLLDLEEESRIGPGEAEAILAEARARELSVPSLLAGRDPALLRTALLSYGRTYGVAPEDAVEYFAAPTRRTA